MELIPYLVTFNIQACLLLMLYFLIRPLLKKAHYPAALSTFFGLICSFGFIAMHKDIQDFPSLLHLPWFAPQFESPIAAFAVDNGTDWARILFHGWWIGAAVSALLMALSHALFRRRVKMGERPLPERVRLIAEEEFRKNQEKALIEQCKGESREPTAEEFESLRKKKMPRVILSDEILSPGVFLPLFPAVLLDKADYTDEQLHALFFYAFGMIRHAQSTFDLYALLTRVVCWFNPLFHVLGRTIQDENRVDCDRQILLNEKDDAVMNAHLSLLDALVTEERPSTHYLRIGSNAEQTDARKEALHIPDKKWSTPIALLSLTMLALIVGTMFVIQPELTNPVTEQTVFALLDTPKENLYDPSDSYSIPLISEEENGLLYGAPKVSAESKGGRIQYLHFHYPVNAEPEFIESETRRLYDALCARLGEPNLTTEDTVIGSVLSGELTDLLFLAGLEAVPYPAFYTPDAYCIWSVQTVDGREAALSMEFFSDGAYADTETSGGLRVDLVLKIKEMQ